MTNYILDKSADIEQLACKATQVLKEYISSVLDKRPRCQIALSGGTTPSNVYTLLSLEDIPWSRVDVFLGDERWVHHQDEQSNSLLIRRTLLSNYPGSEACFYPIPTLDCLTPQASALAFSKLIASKCSGSIPTLDLILLGLGEDGHTASLFPNSPSLKEVNSIATVGLGKGQERVTLTSTVINSARKVVFLVSGSSKREAIKRLLDPYESYNRTPAKLIQPSSEVLILTDESATSLLS